MIELTDAARVNARTGLLQDLSACLDRWAEIMKGAAADELRALPLSAAEVSARLDQRRAFIDRQADEVRPHLPSLLNSGDHSPARLREVAEALSPGGAHTGGLLARILWQNAYFISPEVIAALFVLNWHGGKAGFQFLPDPAETDPDEYASEAASILEVLREGITDPAALLTGEDLAFFESLPDRFTVYRGAAGISPQQAADGLCWTTSRDVAEWFAWRSAGFNGGAPVLVRGRVWKAGVAFVKASEFEVIAAPAPTRALKCRPHPAGWRPAFDATE